MTGSDAILVGESWISEHYFTSEATKESFQAKVLERRRAWDAEAKEKRPTPLSRFTEVRQKLERDLAGLAESCAVAPTCLGRADIGKHRPSIWRGWRRR